MGCGASSSSHEVEEKERHEKGERNGRAVPVKSDEVKAREERERREEAKQLQIKVDGADPPEPVKAKTGGHQEKPVPDKATIMKAIKDSSESLDRTLAERKSAGLPTHVNDDPMLALLFMGTAAEIGARYGVEASDLLTIEETYQDDEEIMAEYKNLKERLDACGLPSTMPK
eukprot:TRINITY_DN37945_c0_g1_i1.p2 TRINITY_DN37945_c0_g1~~TRINITY_DN37945_c0_g1_i1.p2  ORF type:complete len:172 (+),score=57.50 TRINITY_DN37945_c0_g1_i1:763-1278(+)